MRSTIALAAATSLVSAASLAGATTAASASAPPAGGADTSWIVVLADDASPGSVSAAHARRYGAEVSHVYRHALRGYAARMSATAAARVAQNDRVTSVQPDGMVSVAAPGGGKPGGGSQPVQPVQSLPTGIDRVNADDSPTAAIDGTDQPMDVDVAVIDTGIDLDHPDLNVHIDGAKNCATGKSADDGNGHGTHVAGTIGARDNQIGVVGMAPGARVWPVRVLNNAGSGTWSSVICGIDFVTAHAEQIEVANMSLGGSGTDDECGLPTTSALHQAICNSVTAGVTYVVAAGNSSADDQGYVPATYGEVITVSALADFNGIPGGLGTPTCRSDVDDTFADFSNYGADVDLIAPGVCIDSTWKGGGYDTISGTSMASPHVAGGAALYIAKALAPGGAPRPAPADVKAALQAPCANAPTAATCGWTNDGNDKDGVHEPLLDVGGF